MVAESGYISIKTGYLRHIINTLLGKHKKINFTVQ